MPDGNIDIQIVRPCSDDQIKTQVAHSLSLGLPDVQRGPVTTDRLYIYANGPSAAQAPVQYPCMALNGAIKVLYNRGLKPTWWVACDPQEIVVSFIKEDAQVIDAFLLASRCHKAVFNRLGWHAKQGRVKLWHINDAGADLLNGKTLFPDAPSVTLNSLMLAHYMGYRNITLYGWDGCYIDGKHHAVDQEHTAETVTADINGNTFTTTYGWLAEAEDAVKVSNMLPDLNITVEGPGMFAAVLNPILSHRRAELQCQS